MHLSRLLVQTLRDAPAGAELASHRLLVRAGYIRAAGPGLYTYLPLGVRVRRRVERILRDELDRRGFQEVVSPDARFAAAPSDGPVGVPGGAPVADPAAGGATATAGRRDHALADLARDVVRSYRQLPVGLYRFRTHRPDEPGFGDGLMRLREYAALDVLSCLPDAAAAGAAFADLEGVCRAIFARLGLDLTGASAGPAPGADATTAFVLSHPSGRLPLAVCDGCGLTASRDALRAAKPRPAAEPPLPIEEVATPGTTTIAALAAYLGIGAERTAKAAFFADEAGRLITAIVRGDYDVDESKLARAAAAARLRPARVDEIVGAGMEPGFGSPVGAHGTLVVVDDLVAASPNLVAGANRPGFHLLNVNAGRDYSPDVVSDVTVVRDGDPCPACGSPIALRPAIEAGRVTRLGPAHPDAAGLGYLAEDGVRRPVAAVSCAIGIDRAIACVVEAHHDEKGLRWPANLAPYPAHLVVLGRSPEVRAAADSLYAGLFAAGAEPLYDDRDESTGVKLTDAELLGLPFIVIVGPRGLAAGEAEVVTRASGERAAVPLGDVAALVAASPGG